MCEQLKCLNCQKELKNYQKKYCSLKCKCKYEQQKYIEKWKSGECDGLSGYNLNRRIRKYLLEKQGYKCELCGWGELNPFTGKSPLEIHHKDGNYKNNSEENLQVLCPNCHSLTDTYKAANKNGGRSKRKQYNKKLDDDNFIKDVNNTNFCIDCGKLISRYAQRCVECNNKFRKISLEDMKVTKEELKQLIRNLPFVKIAKIYNVTDNTIRKWCKKFNLPYKSIEIHNYSDAEWKNI